MQADNALFGNPLVGERFVKALIVFVSKDVIGLPAIGHKRGGSSGIVHLRAEVDDVLLGSAFNKDGEQIMSDEVFQHIREALRGESARNCVKEEQFEHIRVPVDSLRFTHNSCGATFRHCGRTLEETADKFVEGLDPCTAPWCELRVVRRNGLLLSLDNRRLWAMQEAQRRIRDQDPSKILWVRVKLFMWDPAFDVFLEHLNHSCSGADGHQIRKRCRRA